MSSLGSSKDQISKKKYDIEVKKAIQFEKKIEEKPLKKISFEPNLSLDKYSIASEKIIPNVFLPIENVSKIQKKKIKFLPGLPIIPSTQTTQNNASTILKSPSQIRNAPSWNIKKSFITPSDNFDIGISLEEYINFKI